MKTRSRRENKQNPESKKTINIKRIRAVYEKFTITEEMSPYAEPLKKFCNSEQVFQTFRFLQNETKECVLSLHLDAKNRICCVDEVAIGSLDEAIVHPREVFKSALLSSAAAIVLIHNHPSGDPTPSKMDFEITDRLKKAAEVLGVRLLDHIIIGDDYVSFADRGLL